MFVASCNEAQLLWTPYLTSIPYSRSKCEVGTLRATQFLFILPVMPVLYSKCPDHDVWPVQSNIPSSDYRMAFAMETHGVEVSVLAPPPGDIMRLVRPPEASASFERLTDSALAACWTS